MSATRVARSLDPDERAALQDQRDFLLQSLRDLEAEHEAGDVDEADYQALHDDYTARAARVLRALEAPKVRVAAKPTDSSPPWRKLAIGAGVLVFAIGAGVFVAETAGRRDAGETTTGDIRESTRDKLDEALALAANEDYDEAIAITDEVLEQQPDNAEAMTYKGWYQYRSGDISGLVTMTQSATRNPRYPATHALLAVAFADLGCPDSAARELDRLDELDAPPEILERVEGLRARLPEIDATNCPIPSAP